MSNWSKQLNNDNPSKIKDNIKKSSGAALKEILRDYVYNIYIKTVLLLSL